MKKRIYVVKNDIKGFDTNKKKAVDVNRGNLLEVFKETDHSLYAVVLRTGAEIKVNRDNERKIQYSKFLTNATHLDLDTRLEYARHKVGHRQSRIFLLGLIGALVFSMTALICGLAVNASVTTLAGCSIAVFFEIILVFNAVKDMKIAIRGMKRIERVSKKLKKA